MNFHKIGIAGAGTMGQGIAEMIAGKGLDVVLLERTQADLAEARAGPGAPCASAWPAGRSRRRS